MVKNVPLPNNFSFIRIYSRFTNLYLLPLSHKFLSYPRALLFIRSWRRFNLTFCSAICYLVPIVHQRNKVLKETKGIVAVVLILIQMATSKYTVWSWMCLLLQSKCVADNRSRYLGVQGFLYLRLVYIYILYRYYVIYVIYIYSKVSHEGVVDQNDMTSCPT